MSVVRRLLLLVGAGALVLSIVVGVAPDSLITSFVGSRANVLGLGVMFAGSVALFVGFYLWLFEFDGGTDDSDDSEDALETEANVADQEDTAFGFESDGTTTGQRIDDVLDHLESRVDPTGDGRAIRMEVDRIRDGLRDLAAEVVAKRDGCSQEQARKRVRDGTWTDDPYAASFLQESGRAHLPVRTRVHDWLRGRHLQRRVRRTVDAIEDAAGVGGGLRQAPARDGRPAAGADDGPIADAVDGDSPPADGASSAARVSSGTDATSAGRPDLGLIAGVGLAVVGTALGNAAVLLSAVVAFAHTAYGYALSEPSFEVDVCRTVETTTPVPGESVAVSLTVRNVGEEAIPDLRVLDGIPEDLTVEAGEARAATSLQPDEEVVLTYHLDATRGVHDFGPTELVVENVSGSARRLERVTVETTLRCDVDAGNVPLTGQTTPFEGRVPTDAGGSGIEFYATREYDRGDPINRIDWNRFATTRELTTIEFREHRAAVVVVVLDARSTAAVAPGPDGEDAVALGERATCRIVDDLLDEHNDVGAARLLRADFISTTPDIRYLPPATDSLQTARARRVLRGDTGIDGHVRPIELHSTDEFARSVPEDAQVVFVSPLLDDEPVEMVTRLLAGGHDVTVLMPDVLARGTPGGRVDRIERATRANRVRERGGAVLGWEPDELLSVALSRPTQRGVADR